MHADSNLPKWFPQSQKCALLWTDLDLTFKTFILWHTFCWRKTILSFKTSFSYKHHDIHAHRLRNNCSLSASPSKFLRPGLFCRQNMVHFGTTLFRITVWQMCLLELNTNCIATEELYFATKGYSIRCYSRCLWYVIVRILG